MSSTVRVARRVEDDVFTGRTSPVGGAEQSYDYDEGKKGEEKDGEWKPWGRQRQTERWWWESDRGTKLYNYWLALHWMPTAVRGGHGSGLREMKGSCYCTCLHAGCASMVSQSIALFSEFAAGSWRIKGP